MSYRILVIDHDPSGVERIQRPLTEAGYDVVVSSDAAEAMSTFEKVRPDLTVIEALLPEKPGPVLCQEIKDSPAGKATPVVLLLEPDEDKQARARALDLHGCDLLIERSIPEEELLELLEELLRTRLAQEATATGDAPKDEATQAAGTSDTEAAPKARTESAPDKLIDSNGVVDALSQLDAIIEDRTDPGRAKAAGDEAEPTPAPRDREKVRQAERAGDFSFLNEKAVEKKPASPESPAPAADEETDSPRTADIGQDIVDHIDALFASSEPGGPTLAEKKVLSWTFESDTDATSAESSPRPPEAAGEAPAKQSAKPAPATGPKEIATQESPVAKAGAPLAEKRKTKTVERPVSKPEPPATPRSTASAGQGQVDARQTATFAGAAPRPAKTAPPPAEGRRGWWVVAACLSVVLIGGGLAILFLGGDAEPAAAGKASATTAALVTSTATDVAPVPFEGPGEATAEAATTESAESMENAAQPVPAEIGPDAGSAGSAGLPAASEPARAPRTPSNPPATRSETARPPAREVPKSGTESRSTAPVARPRPAEPKTAAPIVVEEATPSPAESSSQAAAPQPEPRSPVKAPETIETTKAPTAPAAEAQPTLPTETEATAAAPEVEAQPVQAAPVPAESPATAAPPPPVPAEPLFEPPQLLEGPEPNYPAKSLKRASGERIQLKLLISDQGRISRVLVERGTRFKDLEAAAVSAVLRWKYEPATENGSAVEAWTTAEFTF